MQNRPATNSILRPSHLRRPRDWACTRTGALHCFLLLEVPRSRAKGVRCSAERSSLGALAAALIGAPRGTARVGFGGVPGPRREEFPSYVWSDWGTRWASSRRLLSVSQRMTNRPPRFDPDLEVHSKSRRNAGNPPRNPPCLLTRTQAALRQADKLRQPPKGLH